MQPLDQRRWTQLGALSYRLRTLERSLLHFYFQTQVLATGLSGLYSSLPTKLEEKGEEWHCLLKDDWLLLPALVQFMNSLEFCNAVIQVLEHNRGTHLMVHAEYKHVNDS